MRELRLRSSSEALAELDRLEAAPPTVEGPWTLGQILAHCAQSIECSMEGYPQQRSALFRATIGPLAKRAFLRRGTLSHDVTAPIPGTPDLGPHTTEEGLARLRRAIQRFTNFQDDLAPHFAYGKVTKPEYAALHAMHLADHLARLG